jgi:hypothetical protein
MQKKEQTKDSTHECLVMNDVSRNCDLNVREDRLGGSKGGIVYRVRVNSDLFVLLKSKLKTKQFWKTCHFFSKLHDAVYERDNALSFFPTTYLIKLYGRKSWYSMRRLLSSKEVNAIAYGRSYKVGDKYRTYRLKKAFSSNLTAFDLPSGILRDPELEVPRIEFERSLACSSVVGWIELTYRRTTFSSDAKAALDKIDFPPKPKKKNDDPDYDPVRARELAEGVLRKVIRHNGNFTTDRTGRLHYPITVLKKQLRSLLLISNEETCEVDVCCSQPTLHASLYDASNADHLAERGLFLTLVGGSDFYETVARWDKSFPLNGSRDEAKTHCLQYLFYVPIFPYIDTPDKKASKPLTPILNAFKQKFPILFGLMAEKKIKGNDKLPLHMQQIESKIVIEECCTRLMHEKILVLTVHDSLIVPKSRAIEAQRIFQEAWQKVVGFVPKFKLKS